MQVCPESMISAKGKSIMVERTDVMLGESSLNLDGGINFRDFGGLLAADGRRVKPGYLFRAGDLHQLSARDCATLRDLPLRVILDYRDEEECRIKPDQLWSGVTYHSVPANPPGQLVNGNLEKLTTETLAEIDARIWMSDFYRRLPFNNSAYRELVSQLLAQPEGAIVQHCAFGKDRTGVGSALVLFALGADEETIMADYLRTEEVLTSYREQMLTHYSTTLDSRAMQQFAYLLEANPDFLQAAIQAIKERYGSAAAWLAQDYQLDSAQCATLRDHYLY